MKNGKKPTRKQLEIIAEHVATPSDWLISKATVSEMLLTHRFVNQTKIIWL